MSHFDPNLSDITQKFDQNLTLHHEFDHCNVIDNQLHADDGNDEDAEEEEQEDFEFTFAGGDLPSPVAAEELFQDGQIRPIFPFYGEHSAGDTTSYSPPVKRVFVVSSSPETDDVAEGPYCDWAPDKSVAETSPAAPEMSKKSNSTGFSKFWRVKDLLVRSNSDGKDAFVFLTGKETSEEKVEKKKKKVSLGRIRVGRTETVTAAEGETEKNKGKKKTAASAYEVLYGRKGEKKGGGGGGGRSYLPYRQDLVGFFTNSSGMSRNVHPY